MPLHRESPVAATAIEMSDSDEILFDDIYELHEVIGKSLPPHFINFVMDLRGKANILVTSSMGHP